MSARLILKLLPGAAVACLGVWLTRQLVESTTPPPLTATASAPTASPHPFLRQWCYDCHGGGAAKGGFAMDGPDPLTERDWDHIRRHVVLRTMPPEDKPAPPPEDRSTFELDLLAWQAVSTPQTDTPRVRRLSRREFVHNLEDLIGAAPALTDLPDEESAHGFDNNGDFQPLPPAALERYVTVVRQALRSALLPIPVPVKMQRFMAREFDGPGGPSPDAPDYYEIESNAPTRVPVTLTVAGSYRIFLRCYAHQAGVGPVQVSLMDAAPQPVRAVERILADLPGEPVDLPAGPVHLTFRLANPLRDPTHPDPHHRTRRLLVRELSLEGPLDGDTTPSPAFRQRFGPVPARTAPLAERLRWAAETLEDFARRAWRRPPSREESLRLLRLAGEATAHGLRPDETLVVVLQAILTSPHFLFLPDPASTAPAVRSYAVAARLSHLLWSSLPDTTLLAEGALPWTPERLASSTRRLLADARSMAFARDFAGQWLQLRNTTLSHPDPTLFPASSPENRSAMQRSAEAFFLHLVQENEPVLALLDAAYTFLPSGPDGIPEKTILTNPDQKGILSHPAVLLLTSYPNRTSPVLRGKYVLETLLGLEPPPPPPNVPTLPPVPPSGHASRSIRATLEQHRADRACASCHRAIDPLGFPLEAFDAIGRPSGVSAADLTAITFTGAVVQDPGSLSAWLIQDQGDRIVRHTAERLLTYTLGRGLTSVERQTAHQLAARCGGRDARFRDLLLAVITHPLFRGDPIHDKGGDEK